MVSQSELLDSIWSGKIVSLSTVASRINAARAAIGDSGAAQKFIRTIQRKGFRFVGDIEERGVEGHDCLLDIDQTRPTAAPLSESYDRISAIEKRFVPQRGAY